MASIYGFVQPVEVIKAAARSIRGLFFFVLSSRGCSLQFCRTREISITRSCHSPSADQSSPVHLFIYCISAYSLVITLVPEKTIRAQKKSFSYGFWLSVGDFVMLAERAFRASSSSCSLKYHITDSTISRYITNSMRLLANTRISQHTCDTSAIYSTIRRHSSLRRSDKDIYRKARRDQPR